MGRLSQLVLVASDIERVSDYAENIAEYEKAYRARKVSMSDTALEELKTMADAALRSIDTALQIFENEDQDALPEIDRLEQTVDDLETEFVNAHIQRLLNEGCNPVGGVIFTDMLSDLERCSDHAMNIAHALFEHRED